MFIFIRVPKTGSSSIHFILKKNFINYEQIKGNSTPFYNEDVSILEKDIKNKFFKYKNFTFGHVDINWILKNNLLPLSYYESSFKFAFVRNPWDRMVSLYRHRIELIGEKLPEFNIWMQKYINCEIDPVGPYNVKNLSQANCQLDWIPKDINFIGRYETIQDDFNLICDEIKIPRQKLPRILQTNHKPYYTYYNETSIDIVASKFKKDIDEFSYSFKSKKKFF